MATKKFTDFLEVSNPSSGSWIVGIQSGESEEIKIPFAALQNEFYPRNNPSGFITSNQTGSFITTSNTGNFVGLNQTGDFYPRSNPSGYYPNSNPSGYITGIDLSSYYTKDNPSGFLTSGDIGSLLTGSSAGGATNIWIPAAQMIPKTTSGCGVNSSESDLYDQNYDTVDFDAAIPEYADFQIIMPNNWDYGQITFQPVWTADEGSGTVCFMFNGVALGDDDSIDTITGTGQVSIDTLITAGDIHFGPISSGITIAGTPAENKLIFYTVGRDPSQDSLAVDARLLGVQVNYN